MADLDEIKQVIRQIAGRPKNVTLNEIEWVVRQLGQLPGYSVSERRTKHSLLFRVNTEKFGVNAHNPGNKQVKTYSVKNFLAAMIELELYEE
jgi:hypothetical protein